MSGRVISGGLPPPFYRGKDALLFGCWLALITVCDPLSISSAKALPPPTIDELLDLSPSQRAVIGPAEMSFLCARRLPDRQDIDTAQCLAALEQWTAFVRAETNQRLVGPARGNRSTEPLGNSSESRCKAQALLQGVHDVLGPDRRPASLESGTLEAAVARDIPLDPRDLFLSGVLENASPSHRPTSVSLPWLYLAMGRRLGYPLRLAAQDGRLLLR